MGELVAGFISLPDGDVIKFASLRQLAEMTGGVVTADKLRSQLKTVKMIVS